MKFKQEPTKLERARTQKILRDAFCSNLSTVFSLYPNMTMCQHLDGILRSKGVTDKNPKDPTAKFLTFKSWSEERLVRSSEKYLEELESDPPQLWGADEDELSEDDIENFYDRNR